MDKTIHAAELGDTEAQFYLGHLYSEGKDVPQNFQFAFHLFKNLAQNPLALNDPLTSAAQARVFNMYWQKVGVPQDFTLTHLKKLIKFNPQLQVELGKKYATGQGVHLQAYKCFARAQQLGYPQLILMSGKTLDQSRDHLIKTAKNIIEQGTLKGHAVLGALYYFMYRQKNNFSSINEVVVNPSQKTMAGRQEGWELREQAISHLQIAADKGSAFARKKLAAIHGRYAKTHVNNFAQQEGEAALKNMEFAANQGIVIPAYNWLDPYKTVGRYFEEVKRDYTNSGKQQQCQAKISFLKDLVTIGKGGSGVPKPQTEEIDLYDFFIDTSVLPEEIFSKAGVHSPKSKMAPASFVMHELYPHYKAVGKFGQEMHSLAIDIKKELNNPWLFNTCVQPKRALLNFKVVYPLEGPKTMYHLRKLDEQRHLSSIGKTCASLAYRHADFLNRKKAAALKHLDAAEDLLHKASSHLQEKFLKTPADQFGLSHAQTEQIEQIMDIYQASHEEKKLIQRAREAVESGCEFLSKLPNVNLSARDWEFDKEFWSQ